MAKTKFKLNSHDLAKEVKARYGDNGATIKATMEYIRWICDTIADLVEQGETVVIYGFGRFKLDTKKPRTYILRGKEIVKGERKTMRFTQSKNIKARLAEDEEYED